MSDQNGKHYKSKWLIELKGESLESSSEAGAVTKRPDLLRRFTSTPHALDVQLMQRTVRLETNSTDLMALTLKVFGCYQHGTVRPPEFLWRIICGSDPRVQSAAGGVSAFSDLGLRYVNLGQRSFLAVDLERREAVGFLAEQFVADDPRFRQLSPLDMLLCMTASSLGLTALFGGCVGVKDRGIMIFGPPNSGKTTASYLAAKHGLEFHADQVVFLDMSGGALRGWGDPFPVVFRPETLDFLPELRETARWSRYADLSFYYFDKSPLQARWAQPVTPICSLFLQRGCAGEAQLREMTREDAVTRLRECMLFGEDPRFEAQITAALTALAAGPIYNLQYGRDPKIAATFIEKMLQ
jgi:hypothetical protein